MTMDWWTEDAGKIPGPRLHGGLNEAELEALGGAPEGSPGRDWVDFSVNLNPYGPPESVVRAVREAPFRDYPDSAAYLLRRELGEHAGVDPDRIVFGNGAADLMWTLARTVCGPETPVAIVEPTFAEFGAAIEACRSPRLMWRTHADEGFDLQVEGLSRMVEREGVKVLYVCNPNNPTGTHRGTDTLRELAERHPRVLIVLDDAFLLLSEHHADIDVELPRNVVRMRSLTKEYSMAGVRAGYLIADPMLARRIEGARASWSSSVFAQVATRAALGEGDWVRECRERLLGDRRRLVEALAELGWRALPTTTAFFLVRVRNAAEWRRRLLPHGVIVRDCASFGLPGFVRIGTQTWPECERLIAAVAAERGSVSTDPSSGSQV